MARARVTLPKDASPAYAQLTINALYDQLDMQDIQLDKFNTSILRDEQLVRSVKTWIRKYPHLFISGGGSSYLNALNVLMREYDSYREAEFKYPVPAAVPAPVAVPATVSEYKKSKEVELERVEILQKIFSKIKQELVRPDFSSQRLEALTKTFNSFN